RRSLAYWNPDASFVDMERDGGFKQAPFDFPVKLNGYLVHATLDSGAGLTVVTPSIAAHAGVGADQFTATKGRSTGIGDRTVETRTATFSNIELGDEKIAKADLQVSELLRGDEGGSVGSRIAGAGELPMLLGADFLHSHHVLIANSQNRIYFTYNGGPVFHHVTTDRPQEAQPAPTPPQP
ncbi:aspartyl protease family protein, partial [Mycobacterium tuberculosis]